MQLKELVSQYHNANARPEMTGSKGVKKLVSTLRDMKAGNIFEGTVNSVKGQKVTLGLSGGQEVSARMEGKVSLSVGQSMFFQVKSNDGTQIAIRPYTVEGSSVNLTLMEALKSAGLAVDGRGLSMVNSMMEEQLSIGRDSLSQMARTVSNYPDIDVKTIVQMQKLDIPITPENASQFENYQMDKQSIGQALSDYMEALPDALANANLPDGQLQQTAADVIGILTEGLPEGEPVLTAGADFFGGGADLVLTGNSDAAAAEGDAVMPEALEADVEQALQEDGNKASLNPDEIYANQADREQEAQAQDVFRANLPDDAESGVILDLHTESGQDTVIDEAFLRAELNEQASAPDHTLGSLFDGGQLEALTAQLKNAGLFSEGQLNENTSTTSLLREIQTQLNTGAIGRDEALSLLSAKEFQSLLKDAMEQQWTIKPEEITEKDRIGRLYEKVEDQLGRLENVMKASGSVSEQVTDMAANIRSNVEFMDQINQLYTYVQVPLQMSGQNASGELYVFTNKKNLAEGKDELSAFLHLDMDNLGSTDVSVKMHGKNVSTNFYFDNDESYALVEAHAPILQKRIEEKGYNCEVKVVNESKKVNFVDDFLKKDQPSKGLVHRYSFDMKA